MANPIFKVTLKRNGNVVSTTAVTTTQPSAQAETSNWAVPCQTTVRLEPYASSFIQFDDPKYAFVNIQLSKKESCTYYFNKDTAYEYGHVAYDEGRIKEVVFNDEDSDTPTYHYERYNLRTGEILERRLLYYTKGKYNHYSILTKFCYEKYKDGKIEVFATNISDRSITEQGGGYVRYLYSNGVLIKKEIFSSDAFNYKSLKPPIPPTLYSKGGGPRCAIRNCRKPCY